MIYQVLKAKIEDKLKNHFVQTCKRHINELDTSLLRAAEQEGSPLQRSYHSHWTACGLVTGMWLWGELDGLYRKTP